MEKVIIYSLPLLLSLGILLAAIMGVMTMGRKPLPVIAVVVGVLALVSSLYLIAAVETIVNRLQRPFGL